MLQEMGNDFLHRRKLYETSNMNLLDELARSDRYLYTTAFMRVCTPDHMKRQHQLAKRDGWCKAERR